MRRYHPTYAAILAAILVGACGGGGDGGGSVAPPAEPPLVQISLTNQDTVARAAVASIMPITSVSSVGVTPSAAAERSALMHLTIKALHAGIVRKASAPPDMARALATASATEPCPVSGTVTVTVNDADDSGTLSPGDSMSMSFVQCRDAATSSIDGGMTFAFSSVSMTPTTLDAAGSIAFQQLLLIDEAASFSLNGAVSFSINEAPVTNGVRDVGSYTIADAGLTVSNSGSAAGYADTFTYRAGYTVTEDDFMPNVPGVVGTSVMTAAGNFHSATLGGDLSLTTPQPFRLTEPDENPAQGQLIVAGMNNTKLGLTAISNSQVRIDTCDDGDGVWEGTKTVDWSSVIQ
jgi:hypothetical protein